MAEEESRMRHHIVTWGAAAGVVGTGVAVALAVANGDSVSVSRGGTTFTVNPNANDRTSTTSPITIQGTPTVASSPTQNTAKSSVTASRSSSSSPSRSVGPSSPAPTPILTGSLTESASSPSAPETPGTSTSTPTQTTTLARTPFVAAEGIAKDATNQQRYTVLLHGTGLEPSTPYRIQINGQFCDNVLTSTQGEFNKYVLFPSLGNVTDPVIELVNSTTQQLVYTDPVNLSPLIQGLLQGATGLVGHILGGLLPPQTMF